MNCNRTKTTTTLIMLFLILSQSLFSISLSVKDPPEKENVEQEIEKIIKQRIKQNERIQYRNKLLVALAEKLISVRSIIRFIILLVLIGIATGLVYLIIRLVMSIHFRRKKVEHLQSEIPQIDSYSPELIEQFIENGEWTLAVLHMHRGTILHILDNNIAYNKNMTNLDYKRRIKTRELAKDFIVIANCSEQILFDDYEASEGECDICNRSFNRFIEGINNSPATQESPV